MKKKLVMKKWVEVVLIIILFILGFLGFTDSDSTFLFVIVHTIVILGGIGILYMFTFYGREDD